MGFLIWMQICRNSLKYVAFLWCPQNIREVTYMPIDLYWYFLKMSLFIRWRYFFALRFRCSLISRYHHQGTVVCLPLLCELCGLAVGTGSCDQSVVHGGLWSSQQHLVATLEWWLAQSRRHQWDKAENGRLCLAHHIVLWVGHFAWLKNIYIVIPFQHTTPKWDGGSLIWVCKISLTGDNVSKWITR